jgi:hypothetical protein
MVGVVYKMAHQMASGDLAQAIVYGNTGGFNNHSLACYDCAIMLHVRNKYCFNVAYLDPKTGGPNHASLASNEPENESSHHHNAYQISYYAAQRECYTGMVVAKNGLGYWT